MVSRTVRWRDEGRYPERNQEQRIPGGDHPGGCARPGRSRPRVLIESGAGVGSSITDEDYRAAGAEIPPDATTLGRRRPRAQGQGADRERVRALPRRPRAVHLPAPGRRAELTDRLLASGVTAIAYETVQLAEPRAAAARADERGRRPTRADRRRERDDEPERRPRPAGSWRSGHASRDVVVLGGGVAGTNAVAVAVGLGAQVTVLDTNIQRLRELDALYAGRIKTIASNSYEIDKAVARRRPGDRVGAGPGREGAQAGQQRAGRTDEAGQCSRRHRGRPGRLLRGHPTRPPTPIRRSACTSRCSTAWPTCRAPSPHTSTYALTNATMPYVRAIAESGWREALRGRGARARLERARRPGRQQRRRGGATACPCCRWPTRSAERGTEHPRHPLGTDSPALPRTGRGAGEPHGSAPAPSRRIVRSDRRAWSRCAGQG